jgi:hypothetical protein
MTISRHEKTIKTEIKERLQLDELPVGLKSWLEEKDEAGKSPIDYYLDDLEMCEWDGDIEKEDDRVSTWESFFKSVQSVYKALQVERKETASKYSQRELKVELPSADKTLSAENQSTKAEHKGFLTHSDYLKSNFSDLELKRIQLIDEYLSCLAYDYKKEWQAKYVNEENTLKDKFERFWKSPALGLFSLEEIQSWELNLFELESSLKSIEYLNDNLHRVTVFIHNTQQTLSVEYDPKTVFMMRLPEALSDILILGHSVWSYTYGTAKEISELTGWDMRRAISYLIYGSSGYGIEAYVHIGVEASLYVAPPSPEDDEDTRDLVSVMRTVKLEVPPFTSIQSLWRMYNSVRGIATKAKKESGCVCIRPYKDEVCNSFTL